MAIVSSASAPFTCSRTKELFGLIGKPTNKPCWLKSSFTIVPSCQMTSKSSTHHQIVGNMMLNRREVTNIVVLATLSLIGSRDCGNAHGATLATVSKKLCDESCEKQLEEIPLRTTESGLQYKDIVIGNGPSPPIGFQVAAHYVAMVPSGKVFDSSLDKGIPYIFRVGAGQVVKGLDEGVLSMKVGGKRRLYIPGELAFPKGLSAAAGRPRVSPSSPVIFDVSLEYIPGLDDLELE